MDRFDQIRLIQVAEFGAVFRIFMYWIGNKQAFRDFLYVWPGFSVRAHWIWFTNQATSRPAGHSAINQAKCALWCVCNICYYFAMRATSLCHFHAFHSNAKHKPICCIRTVRFDFLPVYFGPYCTQAFAVCIDERKMWSIERWRWDRPLKSIRANSYIFL